MLQVNAATKMFGQKAAVDRISFAVDGPQFVGIIGRSGAGKSTLVKLLLRFYDAEAGRILIDGQDIAKVTQASLRAAIGIVPQDSVLFNDTIGYNIAYGRDGAGPADVEAAAKAAALMDLIGRLPQGFVQNHGLERNWRDAILRGAVPAARGAWTKKLRDLQTADSQVVPTTHNDGVAFARIAKLIGEIAAPDAMIALDSMLNGITSQDSSEFINVAKISQASVARLIEHESADLDITTEAEASTFEISSIAST